MRREAALYKQVYRKTNLWDSWQVIRANGRLSKSPDTQKEVRIFDEDAFTQINKIAKSFSNNSFTFDKAKGVPIKRENKKSRPIVMATVKNRIVQRSILDVIQSQSNLQKIFDHKHSFGGIKEKSVSDAVLKAHELIKSGNAKYFITSDITGFFTDIKRQKVLETVSNHIADKKFVSLFENAMKTELENLASLKEEKVDHLFPIYETGVAQGCCLSPLIGNVYLNEFDKALNSSDVYCFRYIDDFIILGPSQRSVQGKFKQALKILESLGLKAYDPELHKEKANKGSTSGDFDYLGCTISPNSVRPSAKSWRRIEESLKAAFAEALYHTANNPKEVYERGLTFSEVVQSNKRKLDGWIKQYAFCTDDRNIHQWNENLTKHFLEFENSYFRILRNYTPKERALLLGHVDLELSLKTLRQKKAKSSEKGE
jgi:hypothetical protein